MDKLSDVEYKFTKRKKVLLSTYVSLQFSYVATYTDFKSAMSFE